MPRPPSIIYSSYSRVLTFLFLHPSQLIQDSSPSTTTFTLIDNTHRRAVVVVVRTRYLQVAAQVSKNCHFFDTAQKILEMSELGTGSGGSVQVTPYSILGPLRIRTHSSMSLACLHQGLGPNGNEAAPLIGSL